MEFRIADTFTDSLAKLTGREQTSTKTSAFDLQMNPTKPVMQFRSLDKARDPNSCSVRVSSDIRLIVHKTEAGLLLCYVDHHHRADGHQARGRSLQRQSCSANVTLTAQSPDFFAGFREHRTVTRLAPSAPSLSAWAKR